MNAYAQLVLIALTTAAVSMTLTKAHITQGLRDVLASVNGTLGYVFNCPYCCSHWVAFVLLIAAGGDVLTLNFWLNVGAVVTVATLIVGLMLRSLFIQENEIEALRSALLEAKKLIVELQDTVDNGEFINK